ncbi:MAG: hypothetical protein HY925_07425 [Elusimicrobia bacterium]|nr:hypothetical protein [Elusimicrobiota bacterium]
MNRAIVSAFILSASALPAAAGSKPANGAAFVSQSGMSPTLRPGETSHVTITLRNTGTNPWTRSGGYKLGSQSPVDNANWRRGRIPLPVASVKSGESATFSFDVTAPKSTGTFVFQWRMVQERREWFGHRTEKVSVRVAGEPVCPLKVQPDGGNLKANIHVRQQASLFLDATFLYYYGKNEDGSAAGPCGRLWCPLGVDGGPMGEACDRALVGGPVWSSETVSLDPGWHDNDHFAKVLDGQGEVKVCSRLFPDSCGTVAVPAH